MTGRPDFLLRRRGDRVACSSVLSSYLIEWTGPSWKGLRSSGAASLPPGTGGAPGRPLEGAAEGGFGVVPNLRADARHLRAALDEEIGCDLDSPLAQVLHWRLTDQVPEPSGEIGAGGSHFASQTFEGPGMGRPGMEQAQGAPDDF